jgi:hypothetical protein
VHSIDTDERRRRLAVRQHLAARIPSAAAPDVATLAGRLVGIHATDPASVYIGARARISGLSHDDMAAALYDERSVLKILGMRRTMFVAPRDLSAVINSAATKTIALTERKRTLQMVESVGVAANAEEWLAQVEAETVDALDDLGAATATELTKLVPGLRVQIAFGEGKKWAGKVGVFTRVLFMLSAEARIIRGRPRGTWLSSMYTWVPMEKWLGGPLGDPPVEEAQAELVRRWLSTYGPGTQRDIQWWTGWTVAETKRALANTKAVEVELDEGMGYVLPTDLDVTPPVEPWVALLPALDTTTMAWKERPWYLGTLERRLFDTAGNAGPTVWADGRIVGGWTIRADGDVPFRLLEDVGKETERAIEKEAAELQRWMGASRVIPRFRTPLDRELSA